MTVSRFTSRHCRVIISFTTVTHFDGKVSRWSLIRVLLQCFGDHRVIKLPISVTVVLLGNSLEGMGAFWASRPYRKNGSFTDERKRKSPKSLFYNNLGEIFGGA